MRPSGQRLFAKLPGMNGDQLARLAHVFQVQHESRQQKRPLRRQPERATETNTPNRAWYNQDATPETTSQVGSKLDRVTELLESLIALQSQPSKEWYTPGEVAEQSHTRGGTAYSHWTITEACNQGRIPEARKKGDTEQTSPYKTEKGDKRRWLIPLAALQRILSLGLPPLED